MTVVYLDRVVLLNLAVDYLLLLATARLAGLPLRRRRLGLCAALGAMTVMWTAMPDHDIARLERENDAVIFQWYEAEPRYK